MKYGLLHVVNCLFNLLRNLTERQRELIEEFAKEEQGEDDKGAAAGATN